MLTACSDNLLAANQVTAESLTTPTATPPATMTPATLTPEATAQAALTLTIWLPEPLTPIDNTEASSILTGQIQAFEANQPNVQVQTRLKKADGKGGVTETLLSASTVAPGAVPALTLIQRKDLPMLVEAGLVRPLTERVSSAIIDDLYPSAIQLGEYNGLLYGLPYVLEIQHVVYQSPAANFAQFDGMLTGGRSLVLPAGNVNELNSVFLVQYLSAGGTMLNGSLGPLNPDALQTVLEFYESAVNAGVIDPTILNYPTPQDYQAGLLDGRIPAAVVTSTMYLNLLAGDKNWQTAPIPIASDKPATTVDGWLWIITANDSDRQTVALRFLDWIFNTGRQATFSRSIHMLPSGRAALRAWGNPTYADFAGGLLTNAIVPLMPNEGNATARAIQNAFISVISGELTASAATQTVIDQLAGR